MPRPAEDDPSCTELTVTSTAFDLSLACASAQLARRSLIRMLCGLPASFRCRLYWMMSETERAHRALEQARGVHRTAGFSVADYLAGEDCPGCLDDPDQQRSIFYDHELVCAAVSCARQAAQRLTSVENRLIRRRSYAAVEHLAQVETFLRGFDPSEHLLVTPTNLYA